MIDREEIRSRLRTLSDEPRFDFTMEKVARQFGELSPAAVLIPITEIDGRLDIVLTKRATTLRQHSGEISFPGGRQDDTDPDLVFTALRESKEEIALPPNRVEIYGALMRMPTITGYTVTAYVGEFSQPQELNPNPDEIDTLIQAPLLELADSRIHRVETKEWRGESYPIHFFDYQEHVVWGATGLMLYTLLDYLRLRI